MAGHEKPHGNQGNRSHNPNRPSRPSQQGRPEHRAGGKPGGHGGYGKPKPQSGYGRSSDRDNRDDRSSHGGHGEHGERRSRDGQEDRGGYGGEGGRGGHGGQGGRGKPRSEHPRPRPENPDSRPHRQDGAETRSAFGNPDHSGDHGTRSTRSGGAAAQKPRSYGASRGSFVALPAIKHKPKPKAAKPPKPISANREKGFRDGKRPYDYSAYEREPATPEYLARLFAQHEYEVSKRELEAYWKYYCLLRDRNAELDLTRIMGIEATVLKHFIDSSIIADMAKFDGPLVDIGSGPGFPGVPIALRRPELPVILAESRGKRVGFLEEVTQTLGLRNTTIFPRSVREDSPLKVRAVISRALESIPGTLQRVKPFLPRGGRVLFLKGPNCGQEVTQAQEMFQGSYRMAEDIRYDLPHSDQSRRLVVFERRDGE